MSISITLAKLQGYKLLHPEKFRNQSYLPSLPDLLALTGKYFKETNSYERKLRKLKRDNAKYSEIRKLRNGHNQIVRVLESML